MAWVILGLFLVMVITATAGLRFYRQERASQTVGDFNSLPANPNLSPTDKLYLEYYLGNHADELAEPAFLAAEPVAFVISPGESAQAIAENLSAAGLITNSELLLNYLKYYGLDAALVAGTHLLQPASTLPDVIRALTIGGARALELNFLPGWRAEEMAHYLAVTSPAAIDSDEFLALVQRPSGIDNGRFPFLASLSPSASLEGYLYPDSYTITTDTTSRDLINMMLERFGEQVSPELRQAAGAQGLTLREAVILASIVEKEAFIPGEKPVMASVYLNRLRAGMPLQADPTVQYALGYQPDSESWWKSPLYIKDLGIESGYNTYQINGLPPGPIANPSLISLEAVANPAESAYLFFVLDCTAEITGTHLFSQTYEEHVANVQRCQ